MQRFFTMICEFRGGTYVSQVWATDARSAIQEWSAKIVADTPIPDASLAVAKAYEELYDIETPVLLDGLHNVWCASVLCKDDMAWLHIVLTQEASPRPEVFG